jgi:hypothetical protein
MILIIFTMVMAVAGYSLYVAIRDSRAIKKFHADAKYEIIQTDLRGTWHRRFQTRKEAESHLRKMQSKPTIHRLDKSQR